MEKKKKKRPLTGTELSREADIESEGGMASITLRGKTISATGEQIRRRDPGYVRQLEKYALPPITPGLSTKAPMRPSLARAYRLTQGLTAGGPYPEPMGWQTPADSRAARTPKDALSTAVSGRPGRYAFGGNIPTRLTAAGEINEARRRLKEQIELINYRASMRREETAEGRLYQAKIDKRKREQELADKDAKRKLDERIAADKLAREKEADARKREKEAIGARAVSAKIEYERASKILTEIEVRLARLQKQEHDYVLKGEKNLSGVTKNKLEKIRKKIAEIEGTANSPGTLQRARDAELQAYERYRAAGLPGDELPEEEQFRNEPFSDDVMMHDTVDAAGFGISEEGAEGVPTITNDAEYEELPPGTEFIAPDGTRRRKP